METHSPGWVACLGVIPGCAFVRHGLRVIRPNKHPLQSGGLHEVVTRDSGQGSVPRYASRYISVRYVAYRAQCSRSLLYRKTVPTAPLVGAVRSAPLRLALGVRCTCTMLFWTTTCFLYKVRMTILSYVRCTLYRVYRTS